MKKMMIALVAVAFAAVAQAASIDWKTSLGGGSAGRIWDNTGSAVWTNSSSGNTNQIVYFMLTTQVDGFVDAISKNESLTGLYLESSSTFTAASGVMSALSTVTSELVTTDAQYFNVVLVYKNADGDTFYKVSTSVASMERAQVTDPASVQFASNTTINSQEWTKVGGSAVPEPTSALLLLMGLAGIALKRKVS